jgi:Helix-turn-helix domain
MDKLSERVADDIALPSQVAEALGVSVDALRQMRYRGTGPRFTKLGNRVRYRWSDVARYFDEHSEPGSGVR